MTTSALGPAGKLAQAFINSKLTPLVIVASILLGVGAVLLLPREEEPQIVVPDDRRLCADAGRICQRG